MAPTRPLVLVAVLAVSGLVATGCTHSINQAPTVTGKARAFRLLGQVLERETARFPSKRTDVEVDSHEYDRTPHVVGVGETPKIHLNGAHAHLAGDELGDRGFSVDNFILLEVFDEHGKRVSTGVVGFTDPVELDHERVDNLGKLSFTFEPQEIDITSRLPENDAFSVRATALDYYGVGKVSDVYLVLDYPVGKIRSRG